MQPHEHLAIIGSGPSAIYLLKHLLDAVEVIATEVAEIAIFEKSPLAGMGMPYSPLTTDRYNLSNISSEELPELRVSLAEWLREQNAETLAELGLDGKKISEGEVYSRLALGRYLQSQYEAMIAGLTDFGIRIHEHPGRAVTDIRDGGAADGVTLFTADGEALRFARAIIATGHHWPDEDRPERGFYASPWPISKLLPDEGDYYDFAVGTLGASLSAFDVLTSLAHRHGEFVKEGDGLVYRPFPGAEGFRVVLHSSHGMLPHLQYDQEYPFREIYRHATREEMLALVDEAGFLRLDTYFDRICRPALAKAFRRDGMQRMVTALADARFRITDFVEEMADKHDYENPFEGMRHEMVEARKSVHEHRPIHWKETMDDLIYSLNFHAELMPAEDFLVLQSTVMPFLMNVIAALPLPSGNIILALYDAGKLEMVSGHASVPEQQPEDGKTVVQIDDEGDESTREYRMFVDCSGQKPLEPGDFPFPALVRDGNVRKARAPFAGRVREGDASDRLFEEDGKRLLQIGGVDIDGTHRLIGTDGEPNPRIRDISYPHTTGVRPYSYGLQACSDTAEIVVTAWRREIESGRELSDEPADTTRIYDRVSDAVPS